MVCIDGKFVELPRSRRVPHVTGVTLFCVYMVRFYAYLTDSQLMPEVNSVWDPVAGESIVSSTVDVSVAVTTPNGLITPIVSSAD